MMLIHENLEFSIFQTASQRIRIGKFSERDQPECKFLTALATCDKNISRVWRFGFWGKE